MDNKSPAAGVDGEDDNRRGGNDTGTAVTDPAGYYSDPEMILADGALNQAQKERFLADWAQDLADRQGGGQAGQPLAEHIASAGSSGLAEPGFEADRPNPRAGIR